MSRQVFGMRGRPHKPYCSCCRRSRGAWSIRRHASAAQPLLSAEQQLSRALAVPQAFKDLHAEGGAQQAPPNVQIAPLLAAQLTLAPPPMLSAPHSTQRELPAAQAAAAPAQAVPVQAQLPAHDTVDITEDGSSHAAASNAAAAEAGRQQALVAQGGPHEARTPSAEGRPASGRAPAAQGGQRQPAPQQQQGTSGCLRQPPVRASVVGQAVTSPPPLAASALQLMATPPPLWPTAAAPGAQLATAAPAPQGTLLAPLRRLSAALVTQQQSSSTLEQHHTAATHHALVHHTLPDLEQVQSVFKVWQAQLQYRSAVEELLKQAEELQQLPGVHQFLHRVQDDVQVGGCLACCSCWSAGTALQPAKASSVHMHDCKRG